MNNQGLIELKEDELQEVQGGGIICVIAVASGVVTLVGFAIDIYDNADAIAQAFNEGREAAK